MLSNTCKTAIKAVIYLASKADRNEKAGVKEVAQNINASEHTVSKILQNLVKQKIINSIKGPTGGFFITEAQRQQPIINIVIIVQDPSEITEDFFIIRDDQEPAVCHNPVKIYIPPPICHGESCS